MKHLVKYTFIKILSTVFIIGLNSFSLFSQEQNNSVVKGLITFDKKPLEEVTVSLLDGFKYVYSDHSGNYTINAKRGDVLYITKSGFQSIELEVKNNNEILNIELKKSSAEQVYKVGYGEQTKTSLLSSVSTISCNNFENLSVSSAEKALVGKATGLTILQSSGNEPGYESSDIYIRGVGTFGQWRSPLLLVDDIERNFSQLDVQEIESVSILKDGAANAQYGQRGANGTILISTKRGKVGKTEIDFTSQLGLQQPTRLPQFLDSEEYVTLYRKALTNDGLAIPTDAKYDPSMYDGTHDPYLYPNVDWYKSFLKTTAPQQQYKISFRGGNEAIRYYILFGYLNQNGLYKYTDLNDNFNSNIQYDRYNIRSNFDATISKSFIISLDLAGQIETRNMPNVSSSTIFNSLSTIAPNAMPIYYEDGKIAGTSQYQTNPYGMLSSTGYRQDKNKALQVKATGIHKLDFITSGLSAKVTVAYDGISSYGMGKSSNYATYELQSDSTYNKYGEDKQLSLTQEKFADYYQYMLAFYGGFSYNKDWSKQTVSTEIRYYQSQQFKQGDNPPFSRQGINGKASYNFDKRYFAEFSFSYDGCEEFAPGKRFGFFPSIAGGWLISNESFFKKDAVVNFLKIRASYGEAGNSKTGYDRYAYQSHWSGFDSSFGGYIFGSGYSWSDGAWEGRLSNPDLTWETSHTINAGIDIDLFKTVSINFDLFQSNRTNIISEQSNTSPLTVGAPFSLVNIGSVLNRGFEFALSHENKIGKLGYFAHANVSFARNKITSMDEVAGLKDYQSKIGKSVTQLWGLEAIGFYKDQNDISNSPLSTFYKIQPGDIKYKNQNPDEDNVIDIYDEVPMGFPTIPEWTFGLNFGVDYSGFDLSASISSVANRSVYLNNAAVWVIQNNNKATDLAYRAWEANVNEESASYPRLTTENNLNNFRSSSFWIVNGNFIRLNNLELGYSIPNSLTRKINIKTIRLYVNGQNLFSLDHLSKYHLDPEVVDAGITGYPVMKTFNAGFIVKF